MSYSTGLRRTHYLRYLISGNCTRPYPGIVYALGSIASCTLLETMRHGFIEFDTAKTPTNNLRYIGLPYVYTMYTKSSAR